MHDQSPKSGSSSGVQFSFFVDSVSHLPACGLRPSYNVRLLVIHVCALRACLSYKLAVENIDGSRASVEMRFENPDAKLGVTHRLTLRIYGVNIKGMASETRTPSWYSVCTVQQS